MAQIPEYVLLKEFVLNIIINTVVSIFGLSLFFVLITFIIRAIRIKKKIIKKRYSDLIEQVLYNYIFSEDALDETLQALSKESFSSQSFFKKILLKTLIVLHQNYSKQYKEKLELLYIKLGLHKYSLKKIKSFNWDNKIEAIKNLSSLNYQPAFESIQKLIDHKNVYVQSHAVLGCFILRGFEGLFEKKDNPNLFLNDWIQCHIIYYLKKNVIPFPENLDLFLESKNESFILLGIRLMDYYKANQYIPLLQKKLETTKSEVLKNEYCLIINNLNSY